MSKNVLNESNFQLDLLFTGNKEPAEAFDELKDMFQCLESIDKLFLSSIDPDLHLDYSLDAIEFGSIKTWVAQIIREIPDDAISNFDWKKLVGHFLLKLKYLVLKHLEKNTELNSKDQLEALSKEIESEKKTILLDGTHIITEVNIYLLMNILEPLVNTLSRLKDEEQIEFRSQSGVASLNNKIKLDKAQILWELGDKKFENETTEILKIKKSDFLSNNSNWSFKWGHKSIEAKIVDQEWLEKYHNRNYPLLPEDSLKVKLKTSYIGKPDGKIVKATYEIRKVIDIIYPSDDEQISM